MSHSLCHSYANPTTDTDSNLLQHLSIDEDTGLLETPDGGDISSPNKFNSSLLSF